MTGYDINILYGLAGFFVLLSMNSVIVHRLFSHKYRFTGLLSRFYHRLGIFFIALFSIQTLFPLYLVIINFMRISGVVALPDIGTVFFERMYLALFLVINIASFYLVAKLIESMEKMVESYSFIGGKKMPDQQLSAPKITALSIPPRRELKKKIRHIYFTPKKKK